MSQGRTADAALARALESARFVRIVTRADGAALAAGGVLARALSDLGSPFQVSVAATVAERGERVADGEGDETTVVVGPVDATGADDASFRLDDADRPVALAASDLVRDLGERPDPVLALAGAFAAGVEPGAGETERLLERAADGDLIQRRPGVAVPTADLADGLAHTTLVRAPWSGDVEAAREALESADADGEFADADGDSDDARRRAGSVVALDAVGAGDASETAATAVGRALRPYAAPESPFATIGGYADVLEATAGTRPGTGVALAMDHGVREAALEAWREHGRAVHAALADASTGRYDGLFVVDAGDGPVETVARVAANYRSPEPVVLAVGEGEAALAALEDDALGAAVEAIARDLGLGGAYDVGRRRGYLRYGSDTDDATIISTVRDRL